LNCPMMSAPSRRAWRITCRISATSRCAIWKCSAAAFHGRFAQPMDGTDATGIGAGSFESGSADHGGVAQGQAHHREIAVLWDSCWSLSVTARHDPSWMEARRSVTVALSRIGPMPEWAERISVWLAGASCGPRLSLTQRRHGLAALDSSRCATEGSGAVSWQGGPCRCRRSAS